MGYNRNSARFSFKFNEVSDLQVEWQILGRLKTEYKTP